MSGAHPKPPYRVADPSETTEVVEELIHDRHRRLVLHCIRVKVIVAAVRWVAVLIRKINQTPDEGGTHRAATQAWPS